MTGKAGGGQADPGFRARPKAGQNDEGAQRKQDAPDVFAATTEKRAHVPAIPEHPETKVEARRACPDDLPARQTKRDRGSATFRRR